MLSIKGIRIFLSGILLLLFISSSSFAASIDYMDFLMRIKLNHQYEKDLITEAGERSIEERWALIGTGNDDRVGASQSYVLMQELLAGKELDELDYISGFITEETFLESLSFPQKPGISKQLIILQASLASIASLCRIGDPESLGLARNIFRSLEKTDVMRILSSIARPEEHEILSEHFSTTRDLFEKVFKGNFT